VGIDVLAQRIEINPKVMTGKPVIKGTRIPVELILRKLGEGATVEDLLDGYHKPQPEGYPGRACVRRQVFGRRRDSRYMNGLRFLANGSCDFALVRALRGEGHDVLAVGEVRRDAEDEQVDGLAGREGSSGRTARS